MPIADRASTVVLSTLPAGQWQLIGQVPKPMEAGFDVLEARWLADFRGEAKTAVEVMEAFPLGMRFGALDFWLREATPQRVGGNVWIVACRYEGRIRAAKPPHLAISGAAGADSLVITGPGTGSTTLWNSWLPFPVTLTGSGSLSLSIRENVAAFEYSYFAIGEPRSDLIGCGEFGGVVRVSPPVYMPTRGFPWSDFTSASWRLNVPAGWVLDDLRAHTITGSSPKISWITEAWVNTPLYKPQS